MRSKSIRSDFFFFMALEDGIDLKVAYLVVLESVSENAEHEGLSV